MQHTTRGYLRLDTLEQTGLRMAVEVYFKDPNIAEIHEGAGIEGALLA
jgi:hypothetical protein